MTKRLEFTKDQITTITDLYFNKHLSSNKIGEMLGMPGEWVRKAIKRNGLRLRTTSTDRANALYIVDDTVFDEIDSEGKAWALGFILSDGHVTDSGNIMFSQSASEMDMLENIKTVLSSNAPIKEKGQYRTLTITSAKIGSRLREMGIGKNKSRGYDFDKVISFIPDTYMRHFLRGMFDGDGSIRIYKYPYFKKHSAHFGFTNIYDAVYYMSEFLGLKTKIVKECEYAYTCVSANRGKIIEIYKSLYDGAKYFCKRKKDAFEQLIEIYKKEG